MIKKPPTILKPVNLEIYNYWQEYKKTLTYTVSAKKKRCNYTRTRGHVLKRLKDVWRHPRGTQYHRGISVPSIGHKNPDAIRFTISAYGLMPRVINNATEYKKVLETPCLPIIAKSVGTKKRYQILEAAKLLKAPLYLAK